MPGGSPVIDLHGAEDRLVNEMGTYSGLWTSAERTRMELRVSRVRKREMQQLMKKRLGPGNLNAIRRRWKIR